MKSSTCFIVPINQLVITPPAHAHYEIRLKYILNSINVLLKTVRAFLRSINVIDNYRTATNGVRFYLCRIHIQWSVVAYLTRPFDNSQTSIWIHQWSAVTPNDPAMSAMPPANVLDWPCRSLPQGEESLDGSHVGGRGGRRRTPFRLPGECDRL